MRHALRKLKLNQARLNGYDNFWIFKIVTIDPIVISARIWIKMETVVVNIFKKLSPFSRLISFRVMC